MYTILLEDASSDVSKVLSLYRIYDHLDVDKAIDLGQAVPKDYGWPSTLTEKVNNAIRHHPEHVALEDTLKFLTYAEMDQRVNCIASMVFDHETGLNPRIAVLREPSVDWVINMLAILRCGGVRVRLDDTLPDERLAMILKASKASIVLCHAKTISRARILLSQPGMINYLASKAERLVLKREIVLQQSALASTCLSHKPSKQSVTAASRGDPVALSKLIVKHEVTFTLGTPTEYLMLLRCGGVALRQQSTWRNACSGGEAITQDLKHAFLYLQTPPIVTDCYGPTEISCCATMHTVNLNKYAALDHDGETVGKANPNTSIHILDKSNNFLPTGMPGEIAVGGVGVALGYLDTNISKYKFLPSLVDDINDAAHGWRKTMYKTGDKGLLYADGTLCFMGRLGSDTTIELRGLRVDLEGIANTMLCASRGAISDAIITVRGDPAFLVAHAVLARGSDIHEADLKSFAATLSIARYMRSAMVVALAQLPMSTNALPSLRHQTRPLTLTEGELKLLWASVLNQTVTGTHLDAESDFSTVGGTSLLLIKLHTLEGMATLIVNQEDGFSAPAIDWDLETALPQNINFTASPRPAIYEAGKSIEVLLTGSTSFIGGGVLSSLLPIPTVGRIHCVTLDPERDSQHRNHERITTYVGSLSETNFGLDRDTFTNLMNIVDRIILAGAQGHCLNNYTSLRDDAPLEDALNALLRYSILMQAVPHVGNLSVKGHFDFKDVHEVADKIVSAAISDGPLNQENKYPRFQHHFSGKRIVPVEFKQYMELFYGGKFKELPLDEWIVAARHQGLEELIITYLRAVTERGDALIYPYMREK
ncbi:acetyl-CoA synthetase-like protein [Polychaeton citri CBS 116435]|uniref:Acetyl-CoA synthetase-like protein n=1 Tax=Polychaeton citri CBS 116435 TaxID=1314669 RepID=A0A9P4UK44_9PEZI|nr:acetyl-CoA synthetase-like protein [Polychaeton citri CBS 116435]